MIRCSVPAPRRGLALWLAVLAIPVWLVTPALAQRGNPEVEIGTVQVAFRKIDILVGELEVLSGGQSATDLAGRVRGILIQDLRYSGLFRIGASEADGDSLDLEFAIEGTVEGRLPGADPGAEEAPPVLTLKLLSYPERQLILQKGYRPRPEQQRVSAHHFANQVIDLLAGEGQGISLTQVVFSRGSGDRRDLYVVDYDGANLLRVTANRTLNLCPSWSPDRKHIAFTSYNEGHQGAYLLETASGEVRQLIATQGLNLGASWHPDGQEVILSLSKDGSPDIYRIDLDGIVKRRLTFSPAIEISPCWSPGGLDVVFTSDRTGTPQLYIMDGEGAGRRRLTFEGRYNDSAVWSPNGEQVVYACRVGNFTQLVLIQTTGENRRVLTDGSWRSCEDPSWAPDGRHVVFASDRTGVFKLYVMDVVERNVRQLTFGPEPDITPAWSP